MSDQDPIYQVPEQRGFGSTPTGAAVGEFVNYLLENFIPSSPEEAALELSPIGKAIGLIPPKYIRQFAQRLEHGVRNFTGFRPEQAEIIADQIRQNPRVSANLSRIDPGDFNLAKRGSRGEYYSNIKNAKNIVQRVEPGSQYIPERLLNGILAGDVTHPGGSILIRPDIDDVDFGRVMRHEFNHAAEDMTGKLDDLHGWADSVPYAGRPQEIGSRLSEYRHRWLKANANAAGMSVPEWLAARKAGTARKYFETPTMPAAFQAELNHVEQYLPTDDPKVLQEWNNALMYMNHEMKKRGKGIRATMPDMATGSMQQVPKRRFQVEDIVLGLPSDRKLW